MTEKPHVRIRSQQPCGDGSCSRMTGGDAESMMGSRSEGKRAAMKYDNKHRTQMPALRRQQSSAQRQAEIRAAANRPVSYTEDAPRLTAEELAEFKRLNAEGRRKVNCTLRLSKASLDWWKSLGDGYTAVMSRMLEEARNYPELLKRIV